MTWAPWAAASRAASSCLSIISSLEPAQSVCSSAAFTIRDISYPFARSIADAEVGPGRPDEHRNDPSPVTRPPRRAHDSVRSPALPPASACTAARPRPRGRLRVGPAGTYGPAERPELLLA